MIDSRRSILLPLGLLALLPGCGKEAPPPEPVAIPAVMVMASDFAFQMPDTLTAGVTTLRLMNHGQEFHHLVLVKLPDNMSMADFQRLNPEAPVPEGVVFKGGPNAASPGGTAEATVDLTPGRYAVICLIPSADGKPHVAKGMAREVVVIPGDNQAVLPEPTITMRLVDYAFQPTPALAPGQQVIRIENTGNQWHELVLVRLEPGKSAPDLPAWIEKMEGPPPATVLNGVGPLGPGEANVVSVNLEAGEYALYCFLPDRNDGKPHLVHGMMQQISVK